MTEAFPLKWPFGRERTKPYARKSSPFKTTPARARDELLRELKLLGASSVVITTNVATYRRAGIDIPYANQQAVEDDPGVAVYYMWKGEQYCLSCDKWKGVWDNVQALNKTVDAIRGIERWGTGEMMKAAFAGFKELPEQSTRKPWYEILQVRQNATYQEIKDAYRKRAFETHPDHGGTSHAFNEVQDAYELGIIGK